MKMSWTHGFPVAFSLSQSLDGLKRQKISSHSFQPPCSKQAFRFGQLGCWRIFVGQFRARKLRSRLIFDKHSAMYRSKSDVYYIIIVLIYHSYTLLASTNPHQKRHFRVDDFPNSPRWEMLYSPLEISYICKYSVVILGGQTLVELQS